MPETFDATRVSGVFLATLFDVAPSTIGAWRAQGMPLREDGMYDARACMRWWARRKVRVAEGDEEAQAKADRLRARLLELKVEREEGKLIPLENALAVWGRAVVNAKTGILSIPNAIELLLPNELRPTLVPEIRARIEAALRELADAEKPEEYVTKPEGQTQ